ncbi:Uncharacterized protein FKW44_001215, partial [Caligus rogercresseyi]
KSEHNFNGSASDIWASERNNWMQKQQQQIPPDYMSEVGSTATTSNMSQLYRSLPHHAVTSEHFDIEENDGKRDFIGEELNGDANSSGGNNNRM